GREDAVRRDDPLELGEDVLLHRGVLEHGLEDEVAAGELLPAGASRNQRAEESRLAFAEPPAPREVAELVRDPGGRLVHLLLSQVAENHRDLEAPEHQERELPGHEPCADDAEALDASWLCVRHSDTALRTPLDEVERVHGRLRLRAG